MYNDFYVTDANKYRASASTATNVLSAVFTSEELVELTPNLIFSFGNDAWDVLASELDLTPIDGEHDSNAGITEFDGRLYASQRLIDTHVIPLLHMSGQAFGAQRTPHEYGQRLAHALQTWKSIRS